MSFFADGVEQKLTICGFIKAITMRMFMRNFSPLRMMSTSFDRSYLTKHEKEIYSNIVAFRNFIKDLIKVKK